MPPVYQNGNGFNSPRSTAKKRKQRRGTTGGDRRADQADRPSGSATQGGGGGGSQGQDINKSSPTVDLLDQPLLRPQSDFGNKYVPANYSDLYANPDVLATGWMQDQGLNPGNAGGSLKVYNDLAAAMPQLFMLTQGAGTDLKNSSYANFLDYAQEFMDAYSTPGGGTVSPDAIGNIFNADPNSGIAKLLNDPNADTSQQINTLMGLLGGGLATSMPGGIASSVMGSAEQLAKEFQNSKWSNKPGSGGDPGTFADFLRSKGFDQQF